MLTTHDPQLHRKLHIQNPQHCNHNLHVRAMGNSPPRERSFEMLDENKKIGQYAKREVGEGGEGPPSVLF